MTEKSLKPGWKVWRFDHIAENIGERADPTPDDSELYVGLEHMDTNSLRIRRWGSKTDLIGQKLKMRKGDILFARRNAYLKRVAIAPHDGLFSAHGMVLRAKADAIVPDFLPYFMQSDLFMNRAVAISVGSLSPTINWKAMAVQEFALPPVREQLRLVDVFSAFDEQIESLESANSSARTLKSSLAEKAFPVSEVRNYLNSPDEYRGRELAPIRELVTFQVGYPFRSAEYSSQGDRLLRGSNVGVNQLNWEPEITCYWPTERRSEVSEYVLIAGDIVIAMDRPFIAEGFKVARIAQDDLPALLLQRVGRFKVGEQVEANCLWVFLHSESFKWQLQRMQKGTDLPHISKFDIEGTLMPKLTLDEQTAVAECFSEIDTSTSALEARIASANFQRQLAFHTALGGET